MTTPEPKRPVRFMTDREIDRALEEMIEAAIEKDRSQQHRRTFWLRMVALSLVALLIIIFFPQPAHAADRRPADQRCEWSNPGGSRYMLPLEVAVDRLQSIPADVREKLKARLLDPRKHVNADDHVLITRDFVAGEAGLWSLWDMNGGQGEVCWGEVTRDTWAPEQTERALVFCERGWCVAYASVCRNISRALMLTPRREPENKPRTIDTVPRIEVDIPVAELGPPSFVLADTPVPSGSSGDDPTGGSFTTWEEIQTWRVIRMTEPPLGAAAPGATVPITTPVPEPGTWAMTLLGLALVWAVCRPGARLSRGKERQ